MLIPHSIIHGDACFAYFNKIWGIPLYPINSLARERLRGLNIDDESAEPRGCKTRVPQLASRLIKLLGRNESGYGGFRFLWR
jgi:hypothetical protein